MSNERIDKSQSFLTDYHSDVLSLFRNYKALAEKAIKQVTDEQFVTMIDPEANSIALIVKHISGNLHSRWRDFLASDGEKPDRDRDAEFELIEDTRGSLMDSWEAGWQILFANLEPLTTADFSRTVTIRGEPHSVVEAINRQLTHYAYHIGQIVFLAKHLRSDQWKTLSVPKKRSADFNNFLRKRQLSGKTSGSRFESIDAYLDESS